jgi:hypothetical protein
MLLALDTPAHLSEFFAEDLVWRPDRWGTTCASRKASPEGAPMDATVVQDQLTEQLMQKLEESRFLHIPLMNRIEGRIRTKEQLATYTALLVHKLEGRNFQDEWLIERIDHVLDLQQRLARYESSVG